MNVLTDFVKGSSDNLPQVDFNMIHEFYMNNMDYLLAESRNTKNLRATRSSYGDNAIGYVQLKRESHKCTVKARITPEHRVHGKMYSVSVVVDENENKILSSHCEDCAASLGGCKHAIAILYWLHRRHEEPSATSTECYWNKPKLSKVGSTLKWIKAIDLGSTPSSVDVPSESISQFWEDMVSTAKVKKCSGQIFSYFSSPPESMVCLSLHHLSANFMKTTTGVLNASDFLLFCENQMDKNVCEKAAINTSIQSKSPLWYELRYGRITASKIYEASTCSTFDGSLVETLFGAYSIPETSAIARGRLLEDRVLRVVEKKIGIQLKKIGLVLDRRYPVLGASPDAISDDYVVEVKCPSKNETVKNYVKENGRLTLKCYGQIFLQMVMCRRDKGLFCVASPNFESNNEVQIIEVELNEVFINVLISEAMEFWKKAIFPKLIK